MAMEMGKFGQNKKGGMDQIIFNDDEKQKCFCCIGGEFVFLNF
jgi:hypothetical protein